MNTRPDTHMHELIDCAITAQAQLIREKHKNNEAIPAVCLLCANLAVYSGSISQLKSKLTIEQMQSQVEILNTLLDDWKSIVHLKKLGAEGH